MSRDMPHCASHQVARSVSPSGSSGPPTVYATDLATLRFVAESRHLALALDTERSTLLYDLWEDRRADLARFVRHMSGAD